MFMTSSALRAMANSALIGVGEKYLERYLREQCGIAVVEQNLIDELRSLLHTWSNEDGNVQADAMQEVCELAEELVKIADGRAEGNND